MVRVLGKLVVCCGLILSGKAFALVSAQASVGYLATTHTSGGLDTSMTGTVLNATVDVDPIPLVPVAAGVGAWLPIGLKDENEAIETSGLLVDVHVTAWSPVGLMGFKPYGRVGYVLFSSYTSNADIGGGTRVDIPFSKIGSGLLISGGLRYSVLPLIEAFGQFNYLTEELGESESVTINSVSTKYPGFDMASMSFAVGVSVGI